MRSPVRQFIKHSSSICFFELASSNSIVSTKPRYEIIVETNILENDGTYTINMFIKITRRKNMKKV
jgi:hypothetical protein